MVENIVALDGGEKEDGTKKKTKKSKRTSSPPEKLEDGSHEAGERRRSCLLSIAAYLEKHGFSDTLSALRSEARFQLEEGDGLKGQSLDLDDVFGKFVESCKVSTEERSGHQEYKENIHINQKKQDKDSGTCGVNENELNALVVDGNKEGFSEKKRKKSSCPDSLKEGPGEIMHDEPENGEYHIDKSHIDSKSKKKKKAKHELLDEKSENQKSTEASCQSYQLNTNIKDKKKRKRKLASENLDEQNVQFESKQAHIEEKSDDQNPSTEILCQSDQLNDKKKKKRKLASENLDEQNVQTEPKQVHIEEKSDDQKPSTEVLCQSDQLNAIAKDKTKKKHKLASGTLDEHIVEIGSAQAQESVHSEINTEPLAAKNNGEVKPKKSKDKERKINKAVKEVIAQDIKNDIDVKQGDSINKNFNERNNPVSEKTTSRNEKSELNDLYSLSNKKENAHKGSSESKSGNAFQRVKIDKIAYADERLKDNSYWAKRGADGGYGAKAQEILGQVRGRDFRHEKTKKKRGSYRGGLIDLQSHSIKFNYSDDE